MSWALSIEQGDIMQASLVEEMSRELQAGEARLAVRRFAMTANNITYAAFGEAMGYWRFFPGADGRGRLPVWGFAEVIESRCEGLSVGERVYGYLPAAAELIITPGKIRPESFIDAAAHRAELPAVYNRYERCPAGSGENPVREAAQMVLQPLFLTSFLIDAHLRDTGFSGAERIVLTSASSKTALALALLLKRHRPEGLSIEGLTSARNTGFVKGSGLYDAVIAYDDIERMDPAPARLIVDFAGSADVNRTLHTHFGDSLKANIRVGGAHWETSAPARALPGPRPSFFFAPDHARQRVGEWGPEGFAQRQGEAWSQFAAVADTLLAWRSLIGPQETLSAYQALVRGEVAASEALVVEVEGR
ncbi:MAG: DUF2855 family protein [Oceanicaulis sp.]|uniref:DUF2855 family protein n=1 Tax=Glycocaulis sp. TaxID=1969725 RepID=UPI0025BD326D|nr:DUF2855 family protein [Glycocaulis sp.]MCC5981868.1 DUF2855 family protein [Oceanicaulis sp.]MCH8522010.1 DUF2855 family protein [Glycocaulis sp.]